MVPVYLGRETLTLSEVATCLNNWACCWAGREKGERCCNSRSGPNTAREQNVLFTSLRRMPHTCIRSALRLLPRLSTAYSTPRPSRLLTQEHNSSSGRHAFYKTLINAQNLAPGKATYAPTKQSRPANRGIRQKDLGQRLHLRFGGNDPWKAGRMIMYSLLHSTSKKE